MGFVLFYGWKIGKNRMKFPIRYKNENFAIKKLFSL